MNDQQRAALAALKEESTLRGHVQAAEEAISTERAERATQLLADVIEPAIRTAIAELEEHGGFYDFVEKPFLPPSDKGYSTTLELRHSVSRLPVIVTVALRHVPREVAAVYLNDGKEPAWTLGMDARVLPEKLVDAFLAVVAVLRKGTVTTL